MKKIGTFDVLMKSIMQIPDTWLDIRAESLDNSAAASFAFFAAKDLASKASLFH